MTGAAATPRVPFIGEVTAYTGTHQLACAPGTISGSGMILFPPASARPGLALRLLLKMTDIGKQVVVDAVLARETFEAGRYAWEVRFVQMSSAVAAFFAEYASGQLGPQQPAAPRRPAVPEQHVTTGPLRPSPTGPFPPVLRRPTGLLPRALRAAAMARVPTGPLHRLPTGPMQEVAASPDVPGTPTPDLRPPGRHLAGTPRAESQPGEPLAPLTKQPGVGNVGGPRTIGPPVASTPRLAPEADEGVEDVPEAESTARHVLDPRDLDSDQLEQYTRAGSLKLNRLFKDAVRDLNRPVKK